jgi:hypothetical protein
MKINYTLTIIMTFHEKPANQNNTANSDHLVIKISSNTLLSSDGDKIPLRVHKSNFSTLRNSFYLFILINEFVLTKQQRITILFS